MKRKLTIAAGIIHHPQILFLDEPTTGIDVASARLIRKLITELHHSGTTIFLTTHYIEEAERLCERIAIIVKGRIVRIDSVPDLLKPIQEMKAMLITLSTMKRDLCGSLSEAFPHLVFQAVSTEQVRIESSEMIPVGPLVRFIEEQGTEVLEARRLLPSLEEVFVRITGIELDAMRREKERTGGAR
jgi:ABC-2 type transport system ATP-binding protein